MTAPAPPSSPPAAGSGGGAQLGRDLLVAAGATATVAGVAVAIRAGRHRGTTKHSTSDHEPVVRTITTNQPETLGLSSRTDDLASAGQAELVIASGPDMLLDVATTVGLGLTGPGALEALCVVLRSALAADDSSIAILAEPEMNLLVDHAAQPPQFTGQQETAEPGRIRIERDHEAVLDHLESELITRTRLLEDSGGRDTPPSLAVALTVPSDRRRLQGIADLGAGLGIVIAVLGPWPAGVTCHVAADGHIDDVGGPGWATVLAGMLVFSEPSTAVHDVIALFPTQRSPTSIRPTLQAPPSPTGDGYTRGDIQTRLSPASAEVTRRAERNPADVQAGPIRITVLGDVAVHHHAKAAGPIDLTTTLPPKQRDVLAYLALHPDGVRRETLVAALWPDAPVDRPYNSLHAALSQIRRTVRKATNNQVETLVEQHRGRYSLVRDTVDVDLWHLNEALRASHQATTDDERVAAQRDVANLYTGHLIDGSDPEWIDGPRESLRRDVLEALASLIRTLREREPQQALNLLERARALDPYNEAIYRDIMRIQGRLGYHEAIPRTLGLLEHTIAQVDSEVSAETRSLAAEIQRSVGVVGRPTGR